ncbi:uncharacterized SAM-binding protein YcdF (DUF218 family) [Fluviicoccus keumensis]|uniref:Uncharacterized SAM-binding protein YcdF (DUF218 family) n=1 Tax=Fluviicoccus keumensis TaxID=1435465 RepID=A0A4Q7YKM2_9GAMM|nr:YdcF family protein [Fluviicoccus keumensis]RZU37055.1 uncharacterized SAM-binding protein YcdF (DUF218 family) [Fluviicoccus keumensis]
MKVFFSLPFLLIWGLLLAIWLGRAGKLRIMTTLLGTMAMSLYLLCTAAVTRGLISATGYFPPEVAPQTLVSRGAQAIVVLGSGLYRSPETGDIEVAGGYSLGRLRYAVQLAHRTGLPLALSGVEAKGMKETLKQDYGLSVTWMEDKSQTTAENAEFSARMLLPAGIKRVVLVTDAWHMGRSWQIFRYYGFEVIPAPTGYPLSYMKSAPRALEPRADLFLINLFGLSELLGQVKYRFSYRTSPTPVPATSATPAPGSGSPH